MGLGMANQGFSPFDIYFQYIADGETVTDVVEPFAPEAIPCHQAISVNIYNGYILLIEFSCVYIFRTRVEHVLASIVPTAARFPSRGRLYLSRGPSVQCMASLSSCWSSSSQFPSPSWWLFSGNGTWIESVSYWLENQIACGGLRRHFRWPEKFTTTGIMGAPKTWVKNGHAVFYEKTLTRDITGTWLTTTSNKRNRLFRSGALFSRRSSHAHPFCLFTLGYLSSCFYSDFHIKILIFYDPSRAFVVGVFCLCGNTEWGKCKIL